MGECIARVPECTKLINYTTTYQGDYPILSAEQLYAFTIYNQNNRNTTKIVDNTDKTTKHKPTKLQRTQLPTPTQMKIQTTSGSNRDTLGKNRTNTKEDKSITTTLHKDETNTTIK